MTTQKKEKKRVPELRFPGFEGEWEEKALGSISKFSRGKGIARKDIDEDGKNKCIRYGELYTIYNEIIDSIASRTNVPLEDSVISDKNDVIIPSSGETQLDIATASCVLKEGVILGGDLNIIKSKLNGVFLAYLLNNSKKIDIAKLAQGHSVVHLYNKELSTLNISFPSSQEQQKIATFLTTIDTRIQLLEKKKTLLEQYKKGVMQRIFKQEVRFKRDDGEEFPKWEEKRFGDVGKTVNGLRGKTKDDFGIGKPYIQYKQIFDSSKINIEDCGLIDIKENENQNRVQYGDVFFTTSSETQNEIATASVLLDDVGEMYLNSFCFGLRIDNKLLNPSFAQFLFRSSGFRRKVFPLAQGSTRYNISKTNFLKLKVYLPTIAEQSKIAHFLTSLDRKIAVMEQQIVGMKEWKKGVLQRMFV